MTNYNQVPVQRSTTQEGPCIDGMSRRRSAGREQFSSIALSTILVAGLIGLGVNPKFYSTLLVSAFASTSLFSALIALEVLCHKWANLLWVVAGTTLLYLLDYRVLGYEHAYVSGLSFAGLASFAVFGLRTIWAKGDEKKLLLSGLVAVTLFFLCGAIADPLLKVTERLHPKTFDLFLYSFDSSLGLQFSFLTGQLFSGFQLLRTICLLFYIALPLPLALVYTAQLSRLTRAAWTVMTAFLITAPIGVLCYNMLPACGPVYLARAAFPFHPLSTAEMAQIPLRTLPVQGARNAFPSLHMTWVLLIWWNSRGLPRWIRAIALSFVLATVLATLGSGEHYFIDLVVAFPFSLAIQALASFGLPFRSGPRRLAFLFGTFTTLTWLMVLSFATRLFWISPILPWVLVMATVATSVVLWHRLLNVLFVPEQAGACEERIAVSEPLARAQGA